MPLQAIPSEGVAPPLGGKLMSSAPCCSPPPPRRRGVKAGLGVSLAATHLVEERYHVCVCV